MIGDDWLTARILICCISSLAFSHTFLVSVYGGFVNSSSPILSCCAWPPESSSSSSSRDAAFRRTTIIDVHATVSLRHQCHCCIITTHTHTHTHTQCTVRACPRFKGKGPQKSDTLYSAAYTSQARVCKRFWNVESVSWLPWANDTERIMRPSLAHTSEPLDMRSAASRHTTAVTAPINRPSPLSGYSFAILLRVEGWVDRSTQLAS